MKRVLTAAVAAAFVFSGTANAVPGIQTAAAAKASKVAAKKTATPTGVKMTERANGGWTLTWNKVSGATSYTVTVNQTGQKATVKTNSLVIKDMADGKRRQNILVAAQVVANSSKGASAATSAKSPCAPAYVYAARGSGQPMGAGKQGEAFAKSLRKNLKVSSPTQLPLLWDPYEAVSVPDAAKGVLDKRYPDSTSLGVAFGTDFFVAFNKLCPKSKLVPFGFSQGADVMGDVMNSTKVTKTMAQVPRAILLADPTRNGKERDAVQHPRVHGGNGSLGARPAFRSGVWQKVQSWCDQADNVCNPSVKNGKKVHSQTDPGQYLLDCASWWTEGALQAVKPYKWNKRALPKKCIG